MRTFMHLLSTLGPAYLMDPRSGRDVVGAYGGTLAGGAAANAPLPGVSGGGRGIDCRPQGYLTTDVATKRNLVTNPRAAVDLTNIIAVSGGPYSRVTSLPTSSGLPSGFPTTGVRLQGTSASHGFEVYSVSLTAGEQITISLYGYLAALTATSVQLRLRDTVLGNNLASTTFTTVGGGFVRKTLTATAVSTGTHRFQILQQGAGACDFYGTAFMRSVGTLQDYFAGDGYVDSSGAWVTTGGLTGWLGTAHASASDCGPLGNGKTITLGGLARRTDQSSAHTLLGGSASVAANGTEVKLASGSTNLLLLVGGVTYTFTGAWPNDGAVHAWALELNEAADTATLYIDGALFEVKTGVAGQHAAGQSLVVGAHGAGTDQFNGLIGPTYLRYGVLDPLDHRAIAKTALEGVTEDRALRWYETVPEIGNWHPNPIAAQDLHRWAYTYYGATIPTIRQIDYDAVFDTSCVEVSGQPQGADDAVGAAGGSGKNGDALGYSDLMIPFPVPAPRNVMLRCKAQVLAASAGCQLELRAKFYNEDDENSWEFNVCTLWDDIDDLVGTGEVELLGWCTIPVNAVGGGGADTMAFVEPRVRLSETTANPSTIRVTEMQVAFDVDSLIDYVDGSMEGSSFVDTPDFTNLITDPRMTGGTTGYSAYSGTTGLSSPGATGCEVTVNGGNQGVRGTAISVAAGTDLIWGVEVDAPAGMQLALRIEHLVSGSWTATSSIEFIGTGDPEYVTLETTQPVGYNEVRLVPVHAVTGNVVTGVVAFDKLMLVSGTLAPLYFDGDFDGAHWNGAADASTSTFDGVMSWRSASYAPSPTAAPVSWPRWSYGASHQEETKTGIEKVADALLLGADVIRNQAVLTADSGLDSGVAGITWDLYDPIYEAAANAGVRILAVLTGSRSSWRVMPATTHGRPEPGSYHHYADVANAFIDRYGSTVYGIELWNEPNLGAGIFSDGGSEFADFQALCYDQIKAANPYVPVVMGGLATSPTGALTKMENFIVDAYPTMLGKTDAINLHVYIVGRSGYGEVGSDLTEDDGWFRRARLAMITTTEELPIWVTETGKSVDAASHSIFGDTTDDEQADVICLELDRWRRLGKAEQVSVHTIQVNASLSGEELGYGLIDTSDVQRPSFGRLQKKYRYSQVIG